MKCFFSAEGIRLKVGLCITSFLKELPAAHSACTSRGELFLRKKSFLKIACRKTDVRPFISGQRLEASHRAAVCAAGCQKLFCIRIIV